MAGTGKGLWSITPNTNQTADPNVNWVEGQLAPTINNSARSMMAESAKHDLDLKGITATSVVNTGVTTYSVTLNTGVAAFGDLLNFTFIPDTTSEGASLINVTGQGQSALGAKKIIDSNGDDITEGMLIAGSYVGLIYNDTDYVITHGITAPPDLSAYLPLAGGTMSGAVAMGANLITGVADGVSAQDAVTKSQTDTSLALKANLASPTFTGTVTVPTAAVGSAAVNKTQMDTADATKSDSTAVMLLDGTQAMAASLNAGTNKVTNVVDGTSAQDAVTKSQTDTSLALKANLASPTFTGTVTVPTGAAGTSAVNKTQMDTADALKLSLTGGTMSGAIAMGGAKITGMANPTLAQDATTKAYVDSTTGGDLQSDGSVPMAASFNLGTNKLINVGDPILDQDATTKSYVDGYALTNGVANIREFGAVGDYNISTNTGTDDFSAIQAAIDTGLKVIIPHGRYLISEELELTTVGQVVEFEGTGGYAYGEDIGANWVQNTTLVANSTFAKRVRTRRLFRGSAGDPEDAATSCMINIQAEAVELINPSVWLQCDYSNTSPSNLGADVDVGIFAGTRVNVQIINPRVIGYFRQAGVYIDVSGHALLNRTLDKLGIPYPDGSVKNGCDGTYISTPYIRGGRTGLAILGASPKVGNTGYVDPYYDEQLVGTVADARGSFGASDITVLQGRIYSADHHSNYRLHDPNGGAGSIDLTTMLAEPDNAPSAVHIDGLAGNSSGTIWGMNFYGTRIATFEAFRLRLGYCSRVRLWGCHIEGRGSSSRKDTSGNLVDSNDYVNETYHAVAATVATTRFQWYGSNYNAFPHYYGSERSNYSDVGRIFTDYIEFAGDADVRASSGSLVLGKVGSTSVFTSDAETFSNLGAEFSSGRELAVADDAVVVLTPPRIGGNISITCMGGGGSFPNKTLSGCVFYDVGGSLSIDKWYGGSAFDVSTSNLTGTTGTDGNVTVSVQSGVVQIENRSGGAVEFKYTWTA